MSVGKSAVGGRLSQSTVAIGPLCARLKRGRGRLAVPHLLEVTSMKLMRLLDRLFRQFRDRGPGFEPEVGVRVPKVFSPGGRGAAVAVREPEPDVFVDAVSRSARSAGSSQT